MRNMDACLYVGPVERARLERLIADGKTPQKIVKRASIVLLSGQGLGTGAIERQAGVSKPTVWRWQQAYMDGVGIPTKVSSCTEHDVHSLTKMTGGDGALADGTAGCIS